MATTINAGRVRFVSRGTYNNSTQYYLFDLIDYNGSSYIAKENTLGNLPTNTQYWQLIAEKGNTGNDGQTGPVGPTGNGIASITKTATVGLVDTYTITYTNGNTTTFNITNGEDGEVTETELEELRQQIKDLEANQITNEPETATELYLTDSADARFRKLIPIGRTTQESTTGKNLFDEIQLLEATDWTVSNGIYRGLLDNWYIKFRDGFSGLSFETNTQYTISFKGATTGGTPRIKVVYSDSTSSQINISNSTLSDYSYTSTSGKTISSIKADYGSGSAQTLSLSEIQIEKGTNKTSFEPYTGGEASPNPNYPQNIKNTGDNGTINEKVQNKNLFDGELELGQYDSTTGAKLSNNSLYRNKNIIPVKPLTTYNFSINGVNQNYVILEYKSNGDFIGQTTLNTSTFTTTSNTYFINFRCKSTDFTSDYANLKVQLEQSSTATSYVPHEEQNISFPLAQGQKLMEGDYLADDGVHHKRGEKVFDGSNDEQWVFGSNIENTYSFYFVDNTVAFNTDNRINVLSNYLKGNTPLQIIENAVIGICSRRGTSQGIYIRVPNTVATTVLELRTWLSTHNLTVQYELVEEQTEDFTEEQQTAWEEWQKARTYKNITHISSEDETPANVDIVYVRDLETVINNLSN